MKLFRTVNSWLCTIGFDAISILQSVRNMIRGLPSLVRDYRKIRTQNEERFFSADIQFNLPMVNDRYQSAGTAHGGYFYQDLIIAQRVFGRNPKKHVDVASRIDGFVAHVASFREIEVCDIRPVQSQAKNISFRRADLMNLDPSLKEYADSVSCLHALEHFGLGRYGDPINLHGHQNGFCALVEMLQPKGTLYLSVPVGRQRVEFNAHKVFSLQTILDMAVETCLLKDFTYVDPQGQWHPEGSVSSCQDAIDKQWPKDSYGLGIFEFEKL